MKLPVLCVVVGLQLSVLSLSAQTPGSSPVSAQVPPPLLSFSGVLSNSNGKPRTAITGATFSLYAEQEGGAPLWLETQNVQPDKTGHYTVQLGSTTSQGLPASLFASGQARWLGVQAQGEAEQPRIMLLSVPYALKAVDSETLGGFPASAFLRSATQAGAGGTTASPIGPQPALAPIVHGAGTVGHLPLWSGTSLLGNSTLFQKGSNLGIGTIAPATTLDVNGNSTIRGNETVTGTLSASTSLSAPSGGFSGNNTSQILSVTQSGTGAGILAATSSTAGTATALYGTANASSGNTHGVIGLSSSNTGIGVEGGAGGFGSGTSTGVYGFSISSAGTGVVGQGTTGVQAIGVNVGGLFQLSGTTGMILQGKTPTGIEFDVDANGNLFSNGSLFTFGRLTAGGNSIAALVGDPGCGAGYAGMGFGALSGCNNYSMIGNGKDTFLNRPAGGYLHFRENNAGSNGASDQVLIAPGGAVGIGTNSPTELLEVNGRVKSNNLRTQATATDFQAYGCSSFCQVPGLLVNATTGNVPVLVMVNIGGVSTGDCGLTTFGLFMDGVEIASSAITLGQNSSGFYIESPVALTSLQTPPPGFHSFAVQWNLNTSGCSGFNAAPSVSNSGANRSLTVLEM